MCMCERLCVWSPVYEPRQLDQKSPTPSTKTVQICGLQTSRVRIIDKHTQSLLLNLANIIQTKGILLSHSDEEGSQKELQSDTEMKFLSYLFPVSV